MGDNSPSLLPIPKVPKHLYGLLGNLPDVDPTAFFESIWHLEKLYGPIFELDFITRKIVIIGNYELIHDVLDDDRFEKALGGALEELRAFIGDGLFSAYNEEENWHIAHRILMPVFGPLSIRKMFDQMLDISSQMILKWDRLGPNHEIDSADDFTRLAFDTIGICAFNYRFNNFYVESTHPFIKEMSDSLIEAGLRATRTRMETSLRYFSDKKLHEDIKAMHKLCDEVVQDRIAHPREDIKDLLNVMLNQADPVTGKKLSPENIRYQMATFLVAGHETTSGTLSFLFFNLLQNPESYLKAQREVDEILGDSGITVEHIPKLRYIDACIKETLRFKGPISGFTRHAKKKEVIAGKYEIDPNTPISSNLRGLHHDPAVWGEDADEFRPERMLDLSKIPSGAFKAFGTGPRACIGRAFAEQEMILNVALILQRFQVEMADPSYHLVHKWTLTVKPDNFKIKVRRRPGKSSMVGLQQQGSEKHNGFQKELRKGQSDKKLTILYGSNAGTCRAYADDLASNAENLGFQAKVRTLDSATEALPKDHPVVIIAPSYEGKPADNAKKFCSWLELHGNEEGMLNGVQFLLFGVGNSEWVSTYHKVPNMIKDLMTKMGAKALAATGYVDVKADTVGPWDDWCDTVWPAITGSNSTPSVESSLKLTIDKSKASTLLGGFESIPATVKENIRLATNAIGPAKMHMEVELPEGTTYRSGDYLVVLPYNQPNNVRRVLIQFKLNADDRLTITDTRKEFLKISSTSIWELLSTRVELSTPVTQRQLERIAAGATDSKEKAKLHSLSQNDQFETEVLSNRITILDILEDYPSTTLKFEEYLDYLKPLAPRQYSISSSPLAFKNAKSSSVIATITYDVLEAPALSGKDRTFYGTASTFLAGCKVGSRLNCTVRATNVGFHLPTDTETPIIMVAAGTGVAPMRGFIQERAAILEAGGTKKLGPALLYFGCRDFEEDYLYRKEFEHWESMGVVSLRPCFSRRGPDPNGYKYTSDRFYAEKKEVSELFAAGAKVFVCGSASKVAKSTAATCIKIWLEKNPDKEQKDAEEWLDSIKEDRYVSDVF